MSQISLTFTLPSKRFCRISNKNSEYMLSFEDVVLTIDVPKLDIYNDTKDQLGTVHQAGLKQLECSLETEIAKDPKSGDSEAFNKMLMAIREIIAERERAQGSNSPPLEQHEPKTIPKV
jgi:hypothetical protein